MNTCFTNSYLLILSALATMPALAADPQAVTQLDDVVVTAVRVPTKVSSLPVSTTVITQESIASSPAKTVADILSREVGIRVSNSSGADSSASIDLRGFGVTGSSNTLILIDGVKQNSNDLSAPNLAGLSLANIERIEIVRGAGAVAYGGGATGGVINVISKKATAGAISGAATLTLGSYQHRQLDANVSAAGTMFGVDAFMQTLHSDHYRDNNAERVNSGGVGLNFNHEQGAIRAYAKMSDQNLRLPGARKINPATSLNEFINNPQGASTPKDYMSSDSHTFGLNVNQDLGANGQLYFNAARRVKDALAFYSSSWGDSIDQRDLVENTASLRYEQHFSAGHQLVVGADLLNSSLDVNAGAVPEPASTNQQRHRALFTQAIIKPLDSTAITLGARRQWIDESAKDLTGFANSHSTDEALNAWELGVKHRLASEWSVYGKVGSSFRLANADELAYVIDALKPQTSRDQEIGIEWKHQVAAARVSAYRYDLENEIHYNKLVGGFGSNVNLDPTRRQGVELEARWQVTPQLQLNANTSLQSATFRSGVAGGVNLAGLRVPMTPRLLANAGFAWQASRDFMLSSDVQYVGEQRLDNDQSNQFAVQLPAYTLVNLKLAYQLSKNIGASLTVNNLFDEKYASYGIRSGSVGSTGAYNLYPEAERNFRLALNLGF